jgi:two-component system, chemotaxis family, chemotaxis protein CheY
MSTTVMIVDDSLMVRQQVGSALTAAGIHVLEAQDGKDALAKLATAPGTSLIVLDVNMPNMNGIELLQRLRAQGSRVPVIMLTTEGEPRMMQEAKALGARGWIIKPFKPELLVAAVRKLALAA